MTHANSFQLNNQAVDYSESVEQLQPGNADN